MSEQNENLFFKMGQAMFHANEDRAALNARIAELEAALNECQTISADRQRIVDQLAARDHYRQQVAELVEAVENMHPEDAASCRLWDRVRQAKHLAARLKEQPGG